MKALWILAMVVCLAGCTTHRAYNAAQFREGAIQYKRVALHKDGLTAEQIKVISSTQPPKTFPVDVSLILIKNGYVDARLEDMFAYDLVQGLKKSDKINRVTLIPSFLVPENVSFSAIQELGVRSLSEYVLVFYLDASELFRWTAILSSKCEINSSIAFILVDSGTSAMLTADRLQSSAQYKGNLFEIGEQEKAQKAVFSEQAQLLGEKLDKLFKGK